MIHVERHISPELFALNAARRLQRPRPDHGHRLVPGRDRRAAGGLRRRGDVQRALGQLGQLRLAGVRRRRSTTSTPRAGRSSAAWPRWCAREVAPDLAYFSLLRPWSELAISRAFAGLPAHHATFMSCNTGFRIHEPSVPGWCVDCPKCRFVFLALAPFMRPRRPRGRDGRRPARRPRPGARATAPSSASTPRSPSSAWARPTRRGRPCARWRAVARVGIGARSWPISRPAIGGPDAAARRALARPGGRARHPGAPRAGHRCVSRSLRAGGSASGASGARAAASPAPSRARLPGTDVVLVDEGRDPAADGSWEGMPVLGDPAALGACDVVIRSPGISRYRPEVAAPARRGRGAHHRHPPLVRRAPRRARHRGHRHQGQEHHQRPDRPPGLRARAAGAAGGQHRPPARRPARRGPAPVEADLWVLELSSFQTSRPRRLAERGGAAQPLPRAHRLARHPGALLGRQAQPLRAPPGHDARCSTGPTRRVRERGAALPHPRLVPRTGGLRRRARAASPGPARPYAPRDAVALAGEHNLDNVCAALAALEAVGVEVDDLVDALRGFRPLAHRLEPVAERDGVLFVNDSIATIPEATVAAARALAPRPTVLLVGGRDRSQDYGPLADFLAGPTRGGRAWWASPATARRSSARVGEASGVATATAEDMEDAVRRARGDGCPRAGWCCCRRARPRATTSATSRCAERPSGRSSGSAGTDSGPTGEGRSRPAAKTHGPWQPPDPQRASRPSGVAPDRPFRRRPGDGRISCSRRTVLALVCFGLVMVFSTSSTTALLNDGDPLGLVDPPGRSTPSSGCGAFTVFTRMSPEGMRRLGPPALAVSGVLLLLVLIPSIGMTVNGSRRWIPLGGLGPAPALRDGQARPRALDRPGGGAPARGHHHLEGAGAVPRGDRAASAS